MSITNMIKFRGFRALTGILSVTAVFFMLSTPVSAATHKTKPIHAYSYRCRVIKVHDGDTVKCLDTARKAHKIRLVNIDAPELGQQYGSESAAYLRNRILKKDVTVEVASRDKYRRELGIITVNGTNINREMVATGNAWAFRKYLSGNRLKEYDSLESGARAARRGLWNYSNPIEPAAYRKAARDSRNGHGGRKH